MVPLDPAYKAGSRGTFRSHAHPGRKLHKRGSVGKIRKYLGLWDVRVRPSPKAKTFAAQPSFGVRQRWGGMG
jgi:hypothetical protein